MKWEGREESENVEDRRGMGPAGMAIGGAGGLILVVIALFLGVDPRKLAQLAPPQPQGQNHNRPHVADAEEERLAKFSKVIFHDTEVVWDDLFRRMNKTYRKPTLVLFTKQVATACGSANSAVGPFYCPGDSKVYIDLSFYSDLDKKLAHPVSSRAYVIAHEVGHHVQRLLGYSTRVDEARGRVSEKEQNRLSVRLELQADFLAGVWAHHAQKKYNFLEQGDLDSALNAARQIGDDRLQQRSRGTVVPDSFTHGTSAQRKRWFQAGFETGNVSKAAELFNLPYDDL